MSEENKINEAKTESVEESAGGSQQRGRLDVYIEIALIFILGVLIGIAVKTEASKRITIGFNDYKIKPSEQTYDINKLQLEQIKKYNEANAENAQAPADATENASGNSESAPASPTE